MLGTYKFVEHSHGEFEGKTYNNIAISNGIRTLSFQNKVSDSDQLELLSVLKEGDAVKIKLDISFGKKNLVGKITAIELDN